MKMNFFEKLDIAVFWFRARVENIRHTCLTSAAVRRYTGSGMTRSRDDVM